MGFVGTRWTLVDYTPLWSHGMRFMLAGGVGLICLAFFKPNKKLYLDSFYCSLALSLGLVLQTIGISMTSLAKSGFLTTLYALFTPLLCYIFLKSHFRKTYWLLLVLAFFGISLLFEFELEKLNKGDLFVIASALGFSLHILAVDKWGSGHDAFEFNFAQSVGVAVVCIPLAYMIDGPAKLSPLLEWRQAFSGSTLSGLLILSIFSSLIAFSLQVKAQKTLPPHTASLLFLLESVFAALFGYLFFQEKLTLMELSGCLVVMLCVALVPKFASIQKAKV